MTDRLANLRDVGGLPTADGGTLRAGVLLRSDAPAVGDVAHAGVVWPPRTVIDLRSDGEGLRGAGMPGGTAVHALPLFAGASPKHLARDAGGLREVYARALDRAAGTLVAIVRLAVHEPAPVLVHCAAGKDRTGLTIALLLSAAGVGREAVLDDYVATGANMDGVVARLVAGASGGEDGEALLALVRDRPDLLEAPREAMAAVLDVLEAQGGAAQWLLDHGLAPEELDLLRDRLVDR